MRNTLVKIMLFVGCLLCWGRADADVLAANPEHTVLFILDVSGSMAQKLAGETKMKAAKQTFSNLLDELPGNLHVGLEVYGHYGDKDCSAIEVVTPPQSLNVPKIKETVAALQPLKGATPIADSLATAGEVVRKMSGAKTLVLISDGEETCGGDPITTAEALREQDQNLQIEIIGFGVDEKSRDQLQAVASAANGHYYDAKDAGGLMASLQAVKKQLVSKVVFRDDFDGEYIKDDWEIVNPNADTAIVEEGKLQIITELPEEVLFNATNLFLLKEELPKQYEIIFKMNISMLNFNAKWSENQIVGLLLHQDQENVIGLAAASARYYAEGDFDTVQFFKVRDKKWVPGFSAKLGSIVKSREVTLKLQRLKRDFSAFYLNEKGEWSEIGTFTELRPHYRVGLFAVRGSGGVHEALEKFDWIEIREIE